jgi:2-methylcitrate dehydratase PrpD
MKQKVSRREFVKATATAGIMLSAGSVLLGNRDLALAKEDQEMPAGKRPAAGEAGVPGISPKDVTHTLARYLISAKPEDLPAAVCKEATRTLLNYVGCAVGGSHHETVDNAILAIAPFSGPPQAGVFGRSERFDIMHVALLNGISSHIFDFDDTHLKTIIHPAGPVVSAIMALSEYRPINGRDFLNAMVLGIETECRIGNAVYPNHYDIGWHITGTAGVFGAAAATGKLLNLNEQQMVWALGLAATQPVGLREMFGTMTKSFHPGRAAQSGILAALLASKNYTSSNQGIEAKRGWANVTSTKQDYAEITEGLGKTYEVSINTYKPFACGIVIHPVIDACIQLRNEFKLTADQIARIDLRVHPLVLELTGKKTPQVGLEGKFSVYHSAAAAIVYGAAGESQFSDAAVHNPVVIALRDNVNAVADPSIKEEQARVTIVLKDGRKLEKFIKHAIGSVERPMSDADLEAKFSGLAEGIIPKKQTRRLMDLCWNIEKLSSAADIVRAGTRKRSV